MNRFEFAQATLSPDESIVARDSSVRLYDGDEKVSHRFHLSTSSQTLNFHLFSDRLRRR